LPRFQLNRASCLGRQHKTQRTEQERQNPDQTNFHDTSPGVKDFLSKTATRFEGLSTPLKRSCQYARQGIQGIEGSFRKMTTARGFPYKECSNLSQKSQSVKKNCGSDVCEEL
jgi:hypothetical protein